jgi:predicted transcriptional regulator
MSEPTRTRLASSLHYRMPILPRRPHRLEAQDTALSRRRQGFESPWGRHPRTLESALLSLDAVRPAHVAQVPTPTAITAWSGSDEAWGISRLALMADGADQDDLGAVVLQDRSGCCAGLERVLPWTHLEVLQMATTSIKLPPELKRRVGAIAAARGLTAHAFILEAIETCARAAELRKDFVEEAERALRETRETGRGHDAKDVHAYLRARAKGGKARRPRLVRWRG